MKMLPMCPLGLSLSVTRKGLNLVYASTPICPVLFVGLKCTCTHTESSSHLLWSHTKKTNKSKPKVFYSTNSVSCHPSADISKHDFFSPKQSGRNHIPSCMRKETRAFIHLFSAHANTHTHTQRHKHATGDNKDVESDKVVKETSGPHCTCQSHTPAVKINNFIYKKRGHRGLPDV